MCSSAERHGPTPVVTALRSSHGHRPPAARAASILSDCRGAGARGGRRPLWCADDLRPKNEQRRRESCWCTSSPWPPRCGDDSRMAIASKRPKSRRGCAWPCLQTVSETIPLGRIQAVRQIEPLLWRPFGWCRLEVDIAGSGTRNQRGEGSHTSRKSLLPVGSRQDAWHLVHRVLGGPAPALSHHPTRPATRPRSATTSWPPVTTRTTASASRAGSAK